MGLGRHGIERFGDSPGLSTIGVNAYAVPPQPVVPRGQDGEHKDTGLRLRGASGTAATLAFVPYRGGPAPLVSGPFTVMGSVVGALLALVGGGWIALSVLRGPSEQAFPGPPRV
jgi:hypothetical protein